MQRLPLLRSNNAHLEIIEEGILKLVFTRKNILLTQGEVMCGWNVALDFDPERKSKILLITAEGSLLDQEARKAAFNEKNRWPKVAMVVDNLGQTIMAKMSITKYSKKTNAEIFDCPDLALAWLKQEF